MIAIATTSNRLPPGVGPAFAILVAATCVARLAAGCFEQPKQIEAAAGYEAQQMRCVEQYADRASIDACRAKVKAAWLVTDAGSEGGDR